MDAKKREIRTIDCQLAVREAAEGQEGESRTITGRAIVFNAESEVIDDWGERFREVILPEAVTMEFLNTPHRNSYCAPSSHESVSTKMS